MRLLHVTCTILMEARCEIMFSVLRILRNLNFSRPWDWVWVGLVLAVALWQYSRSKRVLHSAPGELAKPHGGWSLPDELAQPTPRPVRRRSGVIGAMIIALIPWWGLR